MKLPAIHLKKDDLDEAMDLFNKLDTTYAKTEPSAKRLFSDGYDF